MQTSLSGAGHDEVLVLRDSRILPVILIPKGEGKAITSRDRGDCMEVTAPKRLPLTQTLLLLSLQTGVRGVCLLNATNPDLETPSPGTLFIQGFSLPLLIRSRCQGIRQGVRYLADGTIEIIASVPVAPETVRMILFHHFDRVFQQIITRDSRFRRTEETGSLLIGTTRHPYQISFQPRVTRMQIRIDHDWQIRVTVPYEASVRDVHFFVLQNRDWIEDRFKGQKPGDPGDGAVRVVYAGGTPIPYHIRRSRRAKRVILKITGENRVEVVAPPSASPERIHTFVQEKANWVYRKITSPERTRFRGKSYQEGEFLLLLGRERPLHLIREGSRELQAGSGEGIIISVPAHLDPADERAAVVGAYQMILRETLEQVVPPLVMVWAARLRVSPPSVRYGNQKTKWGSCSPRGIILNIRLAMAPVEIIEYVVVHELCHLRHPDHSGAFWSLVGSLLPDYRQRKKDLAEKTPHYSF